MQVSVDWLKAYAPVKASAHQIAERLTMSVNEVDEVRSLDHLKEVLVGEVLEVEAHPDADLNVGQIKVGAKTHRIVFRDQALTPGQKVPVVLPGTTLPNGLAVAKRTIRGIRSDGMLASARELGAGEDHSGVWVLPVDAPVGKPLPQALGGRVDSFDLDVPANRPDLMGHLGIAREVASAFGTTLKEPSLKTPNRKRRGVFTPKITNSDTCARFALARIRGLKNGQSPDWIKRRLAAVGLRPINAVVDVTNFVMLETGQPLHAYDFSKLTGVMMYVRESRPDEALKTLDGTTRKLPKGTLMIADRNQALGIAGIMGGASSEVTQRTDDLVLECASFDAATVRRASRGLGLRTEASARFEKGLPAESVWPAIRRAIDLIQEICGGELVELVDTYPRKQKSKPITLTVDRLSGFLGESVPPATVKRSLERLGFTVRVTRGKLTVTPPYWRADVLTDADVIEEVARTIGYDKLPSTLPVAPLQLPERPPLDGLERRLRELLAGMGNTEILTHSLVGDELLHKTGWSNQKLVRMANPLSADHAYLRGSMAPRHFESVADNLRWRNELRLFELGTVFIELKSGQRPSEAKKLLLTIAGKSVGLQFPKARGLLESVTAALHLDVGSLTFVPVSNPQFSSDFHIRYGKAVIGGIAEYRHPKRFKAGSIAILSLDIGKLEAVVPESWRVASPPQFPSVRRDLSLFIPNDTTYAAVRKVIEESAGPLLRSVGEPEEFRKSGKRSLTVKLVFGAADRTLTDATVNQAMNSVEAAVRQQGWKIRE